MSIKVYGEELVNREILTVDTNARSGVRLKVGHGSYRGQLRLSYDEVNDLIDQLVDWSASYALDDTTLGDLVE